MHKLFSAAFLVLFSVAVNAQENVVQLYPGVAPGSEGWTYTEKETNTPYHMVYNVSKPTLKVFLPDPSIANGTAVIVCPGGGFYVLGVDDEGDNVARWLNQKGVAAFVLKYRTGESLTDKPLQELIEKMQNNTLNEKAAPIIQLEIADGRAAIVYVRQHAASYKIDPKRIGIMGFSAGGTVAASAAFNYTPENRPDFVAPIYAYMPESLQPAVPADAPPMFLAAASNDGLLPNTLSLYKKWSSPHQAELHLYAKGGHGFGMRKQNLPTDTWIDRFGDWLGMLGFLTPLKK